MAGARSSSFTVHSARSLPAASGKKGVFPMNRIGPSGSDLYVANADGTNARRLRGNMSQLDYHVAFSPDAKWTLFTGERNGDENSDIYRVRLDRSRLDMLRSTPSSSTGTFNPYGLTRRVVFDTATSAEIGPKLTAKGLAGASQPAWSPDGEWVAFGLRSRFQSHVTSAAKVYRTTANGSYYKALTNGTVNSGFPRYSADGRFLDLNGKSIRNLTDQRDDLPGWAPDGERIVFSRSVSSTHLDVRTIRLDGSGLQCAATTGVNDACGLDPQRSHRV
ncbi:hypothetical protein F4824DRAFT_500157 [Ustulina deusta]|nr:hypothetical protein F4824DRAFT_500157 [Ustulina deusta]